MKDITFHCNKRMDERGLRVSDFNIIAKYSAHDRGVFLLTRHRVEKTIRRFRRWVRSHSSQRFKKRVSQIRNIIQRLEKLANYMMFVSPTGQIITAYRANKRQRQKFARGECRPVSGFNNKRKS